MEKLDETEQQTLSNELLKSTKPPQKTPDSPRRNSKGALIKNILKVVEQYELDFALSDTKLKRMNKEQLCKVLAEVMEQGVQIDMAKSVGVDPRASQKVISLGALRMVHGLLATGVEQGWNTWGAPQTGVRLAGFGKALKSKEVQPTIDECLLEIAAEHPDILSHFESPYARLALIWVGVISTSLQKNVHDVEPRRRAQQAPGGFGGGRRAEERKIDSGHEPSVQTV